MNPFDILRPYQKAVIEDNSRFKALCMSRQSGKSFTIAAMATKECFIHPGSTQVLFSAGMRQSYEMLRKCIQWAKAMHLVIPEISFDYNAEQIRFSNGSRIITVPADPARCRGFSGSCYVDELCFIEHAQDCYNAIFPIITSNENFKLVVSSTPRSFNDCFGKIFNGDNLFKKFRVTLDDAINDGLNIDKNQLKQALGDDLVFETEYMCKFLTQASTAFDINSLNRYSEIDGGTRYIGFDPSSGGAGSDDSAIVEIVSKDGNFYIDNYVSLRGKTLSEQYSELEKIFRSKNCKGGYLDSSGLGKQIGQDAQIKISSNLKPYNFSQNSKIFLMDTLRAHITDQRIFIKDSLYDYFCGDAALVERIVSKDGKFTYMQNRKNGSHGDCIIASALALRASLDMPSTLQVPVSYQRHSAFGTYKTRF